MEKLDITIIGAGVIGLAIGQRLTHASKDVLIVEKNESFGQETSSRNSEVIHAGIHYEKGSLKHTMCIEGRHLLYEYCQIHSIAHKKIGKLIVAKTKEEVSALQQLFQRGVDNGVNDLRFLSKADIKKFEPYIKAEAAIHSPSTGILDTHGFMKKLVSQYKGKWGHIAFHSEVTAIEKVDDGFTVTIRDERDNRYSFLTRILINAAGLYADKIAAMAGLDSDAYKLKFCKGDYFRVAQRKAKYVNSLIYPVPHENGGGLGIHATVDLMGSLRLGPDDEYVSSISYNVDPQKNKMFYDNIHAFLPFIELIDLTPDQSGIRPKLYARGEKIKDFIINDEGENSLPGFINLVGIESPGFTACLAIAGKVAELVESLVL